MTTPVPPARTPHRRAPARVAAVHRQGRAWRVLIAQTGGPDAGSGGGAAGADGAGITIFDSRTLDTPSALAAFLREQKPAVVISVLPSSETICRSTTLPDGAEPEVVGALALLAEAELPASIPPHRRTGGVLTPGPAGAAPIALLIGWPERPESAADPLDHAPARTGLWVPEPVALAHLAAAHGGAAAAVYADRNSGSIALLGAGTDRSLARILRGDATTASTWRASIIDAAHQVGALLGVPIDHFDPGTGADASLHLIAPSGDAQAITGVAGLPRDASWRTSYGIPLGAVLAYASAGPMQEPLLRLHPDADTGGGMLAERVIRWLAAPARAAAVMAVALALVLLVPLGVAWARATALESRSGGVAALGDRLAVADREAAFYDLLRARRWPMTKLLADVSGAAPVGIRVDSLELSPEQAGPGLTLRGTAPTADAVTAFSKNLADTRILADVATPSIVSEGPGVSFQLQARVVAPLYRVKPAADFAEQTLAQRMYGEAASRIRYTQARDDSRDDRRAGRSDDDDDRRAPRRPASDAPAPSTPAAAAPPPLTDEAIAAMDRSAVIKEFAARRLASARAEAGSAERQRLESEVEKLSRRLEALRGGGS